MKEVTGLRDRKRRATRRAIQLAAVESVERLGLAAATVEVMSGEAGISPRTFFNHFPTKESSLLGEDWRPLEPEQIATFVSSRAPIMRDLGTLLSTVVNVDGLERDLVGRRQRLAARYPELAGHRQRWLLELEHDLRAPVESRLRAEYPAASDIAVLEATRLLATIGVSAFRSAWSWWTEHGDDGSLTADIDRTFELIAIDRIGFPPGVS